MLSSLYEIQSWKFHQLKKIIISDIIFNKKIWKAVKISRIINIVKNVMKLINIKETKRNISLPSISSIKIKKLSNSGKYFVVIVKVIIPNINSIIIHLINNLYYLKFWNIFYINNFFL